MIIDMPTVSMGNSGKILPADKVSYDNTTSGLEADNVQDAIDEVNDKVVDNQPYHHTSELVGTHTTSGQTIGTYTIQDFTVQNDGYIDFFVDMRLMNAGGRLDADLYINNLKIFTYAYYTGTALGLVHIYKNLFPVKAGDVVRGTLIVSQANQGEASTFELKEYKYV